jgi:hypothetical protein
MNKSEIGESAGSFMSEIYGYIYLITNLINYRMYVGKHEYKRMKLDPNYFCSTTNPQFYEDLKSYGRKNFNVEILHYCYSIEDLNESERRIISCYRSKYGWDSMYNIASGGEGGRTWQNYKDTDPEKYNEVVSKLGPAISRGLDKYFSIEANRIKHRMKCQTRSARRNYSEASKIRWSDQEFIDKIESIKNNPEYRKMLSENSKLLWSDESYRSKQVEVHNSEPTRKRCSDAAKRGHSIPELAEKYRHPNKKYLFRRPDGSEVKMSKKRLVLKLHPDWLLIKEVRSD